jgi:hypothetical protein
VFVKLANDQAEDPADNPSRIEWIALWSAATAATFGVFLVYAGLFWLIDQADRRLAPIRRLAITASIDAAYRQPSPRKATIAAAWAYATVYLVAIRDFIWMDNSHRP